MTISYLESNNSRCFAQSYNDAFEDARKNLTTSSTLIEVERETMWRLFSSSTDVLRSIRWSEQVRLPSGMKTCTLLNTLHRMLKLTTCVLLADGHTKHPLCEDVTRGTLISTRSVSVPTNFSFDELDWLGDFENYLFDELDWVGDFKYGFSRQNPQR